MAYSSLFTVNPDSSTYLVSSTLTELTQTLPPEADSYASVCFPYPKGTLSLEGEGARKRELDEWDCY
jgi:hypothetical protein